MHSEISLPCYLFLRKEKHQENKHSSYLSSLYLESGVPLGGVCCFCHSGKFVFAKAGDVGLKFEAFFFCQGGRVLKLRAVFLTNIFLYMSLFVELCIRYDGLL